MLLSVCRVLMIEILNIDTLINLMERFLYSIAFHLLVLMVVLRRIILGTMGVESGHV